MLVMKNVELKNYFRYYFYCKTRSFAEFFLYTLPNYKSISALKKIKNTKNKKNAFVFANGPSLKILDPLKVLEYQKTGFEVFAGNSYIDSEFGNIVKPNYYIFSDPVHFKETDRKDVNKIVELNIPVFVPHRYASKSKFKNQYIFNDSFDIFSNHTIDIRKRRPYISMTLYKALSIACFMGYDNIYICGFDNNYFLRVSVDIHNQLFIKDDHFYDKNSVDPIKIEQSMSSFLMENHLLFLGLEKFSKYKITNLHQDSLIDSFSKHHKLEIY